MNISCFGIAREIVGGPVLVYPAAVGRSVSSLRQQLIGEYPALGELVSFAVARNEAYALDDELIEAGDELAIIPPVSGG